MCIKHNQMHIGGFGLLILVIATSLISNISAVISILNVIMVDFFNR